MRTKFAIIKPMTKDEVRRAVLVTLKAGNAETMTLSRHMNVGYGKASQLHKLLYDAGVIVDSSFKGTVILLNDEAQATNAALRQFNKQRAKA